LILQWFMLFYWHLSRWLSPIPTLASNRNCHCTSD